MKPRLRGVLVLFIGILLIAGCRTPAPPQIPSSSLSSGHLRASGRILLAVGGEKHTGELALELSRDNHLRLQIFAPLVGSLLYELRSDPKRFLVLNHQESRYWLDENTPEVRQEWLGMDLSLEELGWIVRGRIPEPSMSGWQVIGADTGAQTLQRESATLRITLDEFGHLQTLTKVVDGLEKYTVRISGYQTFSGQSFPRKVFITEALDHNRLVLAFTEVVFPVTSGVPLDFTIPEGMIPYAPES